ncbi:hypothetical protein F66182_1545 [Fusarium sp. NRRL 66182]|nr:hypothetical protein F66182_1545 [Fusarium sp. NRRL 66182]
MSAQTTTNSSKSDKPTLPANVSIFSPTKASAISALFGGRIFTRLVASARTKPAELVAAIKRYPGADEDFCLTHGHSVLIFDGVQGDKQVDGLEDLHHDHFRIICLALQKHNIGLDVAGCIHDASDVLGAGFQIDKLNDGSALVIDLVKVEEESDSEGSAA